MESIDSSTAAPPRPHLPPGFRFHPTDEELVVHYLKRKAAATPLPVAIIADIDIYKYDPWELPEKAVFGEQEWYFFSPRDRKYPNGARPNRAATSGYWKATGTDKPVLSAGGTQKVGVKKALVFYGGKPPKGIKTNWIMHEYRLPENKPPSNKPPGCHFGNKKGSLRLDDWVLCRIYKKSGAQRGATDRERDEILDVNASIPPMNPIGQHAFLTSDDQTLYEEMMIRASGGLRATPQIDNISNMILAKRSFLWNEEIGDENSGPTKRFLSENYTGRTGEPTTNLMATMMFDQLPEQNPSMGNVGEGVFGQQGYHLGINWYS